MAWWFREVLERYWRMYYECNFQHDTDESPATIFLEIIMQWFESGGTYDFIRCEMTVFSGHPLRYSIGRASHVPPGSPMITSWTTSSPTSLRKHFDRLRSTLVIQPWCINKFWHEFPTSTHPLLLRILRELPAETAHYSKFPRGRGPVQYPKISMIGRRLQGMSALSAEEVDEEVAEYDEEVAEYDDDGDESEMDAGDDEDIQILKCHYDELESILTDQWPDYELYEGYQNLLRKLRSAQRKGDTAAFWRVTPRCGGHDASRSRELLYLQEERH